MIDYRTGNEVLVGGPTGGNLKGVMLQGHIAWLKEHATPEQYRAFFEHASPELAQIGQVILATSWYPFRLLIELDRRILDQFGGAHPNVLEELGTFSATVGLGKIYRSMQRPSFHEFLERMSGVHDRYQDYGEIEYVRSGISSARIIYRKYTVYSPIFCASAGGYFKGAAAIHHCANARVAETSCHCRGDRACTYEVHWS